MFTVVNCDTRNAELY